MTASVGRASARIGLLGNPGDLYGGKVLAATIDAFETVATVTQTVFYAPASFQPDVANLQRLAVDRVAPSKGAIALGLTTDVPLQSGLSGSSAILLATLRALDAHLNLGLDPLEMAQIAWDIERKDLGVVAGPQDRVIQALGGLQYMDFSGPDEIGIHEPLDPDLLPPMLVAWPKEPGTPSGNVHRVLWERWSAGDTALRQSLAGFAEIADIGRQALLGRDTTTFCDAVDGNFDLRRSIFTLDDDQAALVTAARAAGAAAKFCGSGSAIVAVPRPGTDLEAVADSLESGASVCRRVRVSLTP
jgi:galactokinase/mevalonate kinase-like predicted kinase